MDKRIDDILAEHGISDKQMVAAVLDEYGIEAIISAYIKIYGMHMFFESVQEVFAAMAREEFDKDGYDSKQGKKYVRIGNAIMYNFRMDDLSE